MSRALDVAGDGLGDDARALGRGDVERDRDVEIAAILTPQLVAARIPHPRFGPRAALDDVDLDEGEYFARLISRCAACGLDGFDHAPTVAARRA